MFSRNVLRNVILIVWIVSAASYLIRFFISLANSGVAVFSDFREDFGLAFALISLGMALSLLFNKVKLFVYLFGAYVFANLGYYLSYLFYANAMTPCAYVWENAKITYIFYYFIEFHLLTFMFGVYAIMFVISSIFCKKMHSFRYKSIKILKYIGVALMIFQLTSLFLTYMNTESGFGFFDIFSDLIFTLLYSFIYITVPDYFYYIY